MTMGDMPALQKHEFRTGEIVAWRAWIVINDEDVIRSVFMIRTVWPPGEPLKSHEPPRVSRAISGRRGIHAWKTAQHPGTVLPDVNMSLGNRFRLVTGWVALWGEVIETEHGYVAEYAQPLTFDWISAPSDGDHTKLKRLTELYRTQVSASEEPLRGRHWILVNKTPMPTDLLTWARWFESANRRVALTEFTNGARVSTVFLGLDHNFSMDGPPLLFESMLFRPNSHDEEDMDRYATWDEAINGHGAMVDRQVKRGLVIARKNR